MMKRVTLPTNSGLERTLTTVVNLVNSGPPAQPAEFLIDAESLRTFVSVNQLDDVELVTEADLHALRSLRFRLHALFVANDDAAAVERVNYLLSIAPIRPVLTGAASSGFELRYFPPFSPLAEHLSAACAMALALFITEGELVRLKTCAASACTRVFIDWSKNRSRLYCDGQACGNRQHTAAYRERRRRAVRAH